MSSRLTQVLLALSLLLNCFVLAGFVYRTWIEPPPVHRPGGLPRGMSPLEALAEDLGLDNAQRQELRAVFDHYADGRRERFREIQKIRDAMVTELEKPDFDMAKIDPLIEQMTSLRGEAQKQNMRAIAELASKLKPEQRAKLHKILADRYGNPPWANRGRAPARPSQ
jgi:Spy/CpxP family protein refolding chaperone